MKFVTLLGTGAVVAAGLAFAGAANAAPLTPGALGLSAGDAPIEKVRDGCGPGAHANIYGECRSNLPSRPRYGDGYGYGDPGYRRPFGAPPPRPFYKPYGTPNY